MLHVQSRPPTLSRRSVLSGAAALAILGASAVTSAGCGTAPPPPDLDDLTTALDRARADSRLAAEVAETAGAARSAGSAHSRGSAVDALTEVAAERAAHAEAVAAEIERLTGSVAPTTTTTTSVSASAAAPEPSVEDVIGALRASADSAAQAATVLSGYRAGLLGSIAAACTASYGVALAPHGGKP
ncbi:MAG: hypothetical protein AB7G47_08025 [Mycolicibacterium sp.]|uniref:hypothetical protein n=1 Tax=Mycolicibacterium sp. TaxID=2320850 RepID=UPI003D0EAF77